MRLEYTKVLPEARRAMQELEKVVESSTLEPKLLELVRLRASQVNGCAHCVDMHTKDGRAIGEDEQRLHLVAVWREAPFFAPRERAALAWTEELTLLPGTGASNDVYEAMAHEFSPGERVALTLAIVAINGWNRLAVGFRLPVGSYISSRHPGPATFQRNTTSNPTAGDPDRGSGPEGDPERTTMSEHDTHETIKTPNFAAGAETMPEKNAEDRVLHRGSFATGIEQHPEENAEKRVHARGGFSVGHEDRPEEDAEKRAHPGSFADTEPRPESPARR